MMRTRSPIEMMVDKACGYDPSKDTTPAKEPLADESAALLAVADAAVLWWINRRPVQWKEKEHLKNPTINCTHSGTEKPLAIAASNLVKLGWNVRPIGGK
jgi:hypothetical protein